MRFIKLENGNVQLTDDSDNPIAAIISNAVQIREIGLSTGIEILQNGYPIFQVQTADVSQTQVLPAAGIAFAGSTTDLIQLLSNDFFLIDATLTATFEQEDPQLNLVISPTSGIAFSTTALLTNGQTFSSGVLDMKKYNQVQTHILSNKNGTITVYFLQDLAGTDILRTLSIPYVGSSGFKMFSAPAFTPYVKYNFTCTEVGQTDFYFDTKFLTTALSAQIVGLQDFISPTMVASLGRNILVGQTDGGQFNNVPVTSEGHLEVAIHDPVTVFGALDTSQDTAVFQTDFVYGVNPLQVFSDSQLTGTVTGNDQLMQLSTGTTIYANAVASSKKRLKYRPGQGVKVMFTAMYTTPVAFSYQGAGCGTAENGVYFGYGDTNDLTHTDFGILYTYNGKREIKTLTITTGATVASNVTITLNGTAFTVPVTASSNIQRTVWEIATYTGFTGWDVYASGATVKFVRKSAGVTAGTQVFAAGTTGSAGTIVQTRAGAASTDTFYKQSTWNGDPLDGTGPSGVTLNPQTLNLFRIKIGYLGAHDIIFQIKVTAGNGNNSAWITVHSIPYANLYTHTSFSNASFPFNSFVYSAGSTTNLTLSSGSISGFIEGKKMLHGNRSSFSNELTTITNSVFTALFTIMNPRIHNNVSNQGVINIISLSGALKHNNPCRYVIVKNATLAGNPNFQQYSSSNLPLFDTAVTTVTWADNSQMLFNDYLGDTGDLDKKFTDGEYNAEEFTLQPGEWVTVCAKSLGAGSPSFVTASLNVRDDI